ncbi:MAG: acyltransferase [Micavibrio aeruginosavorus]|uniref:Acyltransferase n=1 Tax=Micavibrio aeruginosavorus TaxID=349221 RepID=A0A7T5R2S1_9BACT|nr:MAG: acyltransferase [Micavibrio aeruginosavorus]
MSDSAPHDFSSSGRLKVLDGLRAIAILLVIFMHSLREFRGDLSRPFMPVSGFDLSNVLYNGWIGVDLFFVLSGFLITCQLLRLDLHNNKQRLSATLHYLKIRFFRIAPAYYLTLVIFLGASFLIRLHNGAAPSHAEIVDWSHRLFSQLIFMHDYLPPLKAAVLWSLAIELKFYLLAPFLIWSIMRLRLRNQMGVLCLTFFIMIAMRMAAISAGGDALQDYETYFFSIRAKFHLSMDGLLAGVVCALLWHRQDMRKLISSPALANGLFLSGLAILSAEILFHPLYIPTVSFFEMAFLPTVLTAGFSFVMLGLLGGCAGHRFFENRPFRWIAMISYSLYLTHCFFLGPQRLIAQTMARAIGKTTESYIPGHAFLWLISLPLFLAMSFGAAFVMYKCIEKPFIDWSKRTTPKQA